MEQGPVVALAVLSAVLGIGLGVLFAAVVRRRRSSGAELAEARHELAEVRRRLDELTRRLETRPAPVAERPEADRPQYVITSAGNPGTVGEVARHPAGVPADVVTGRFASVALTESVVTVLSFGHGLRRALAPENRNRIGFEMRREVRRSRKQRRRDLRVARRGMRAPGHLPRSGVGEDAA